MPNYSIFYSPKKRAEEYATGYAANLYTQKCGIDCDYCYVKTFSWSKTENFNLPAIPRKNILEKLQNDIRKMIEFDDVKEIFMSFTCDPYQPVEKEFMITRQALGMLLDNNIPVRILTKSNLAYRDIDLMEEYNDLVTFGMTLVFADDKESQIHEPNAAYPSTRRLLLRDMHSRGIKTWASLEPVWHTKDAFINIEAIHDCVDVINIGKLNYHPHANTINWKTFAINISKYCEDLKCKYVLKNDLQRLL